MTAYSEGDFKATGQDRIRQDGSGWSLCTADNAMGARYEHTIIVTRGDPLILSL